MARLGLSSPLQQQAGLKGKRTAEVELAVVFPANRNLSVR
jgi:hypothetical protein